MDSVFSPSVVDFENSDRIIWSIRISRIRQSKLQYRIYKDIEAESLQHSYVVEGISLAIDVQNKLIVSLAQAIQLTKELFVCT